MTQAQATGNPGAHDKAWYRAASCDVYRSNETASALAIVAETRAAITRGMPLKQVERDLKRKGAAPGWTPAVVNRANAANWKIILDAVDLELSAGKEASTNITAALRLASNLTSIDPRSENVQAGLRSFGASDRVVEFLCSHTKTQATQKDSGWFLLIAGCIALVVGVWWARDLAATADDTTKRGVTILLIGGCAAIGRGFIVLRRN